MHAYTAISPAYIMNVCKQVSNAHTPNQAWDFGFSTEKTEAERKIKLKVYGK